MNRKLLALIGPLVVLVLFIIFSLAAFALAPATTTAA